MQLIGAGLIERMRTKSSSDNPEGQYISPGWNMAVDSE